MAKHVDRRSAQLAPPNIDIQVERWLIERLIPRVNNPRTHSRRQIAQIAASIQEFGWTNPILVDEGDGIIAGHARVLAAKKLGMEVIPVIVLRHLSEAQKRALVIADNQLALNAGWDETARCSTTRCRMRVVTTRSSAEEQRRSPLCRPDVFVTASNSIRSIAT